MLVCGSIENLQFIHLEISLAIKICNLYIQMENRLAIEIIGFLLLIVETMVKITI